MSWASKRRTSYILGIMLFFGVLIGVPLVHWYTTIPASCTNGKQDQGETAADRGGPCPLVDETTLSPSNALWARAFKVRDGEYNVAAYIENSNESAGVAAAPYRFRLYDSDNVLVADRTGTTFIMPGGITPVLESNIDTGHRMATHAFFDFLAPLTWEHFTDASKAVTVGDRKVTDITTAPRISATAHNSSVSTLLNISFVAVVFDTAGNAFAASATKLDRLDAGSSAPLVFTWPTPFPVVVGRVDIIPLVPPAPAWTAQ